MGEAASERKKEHVVNPKGLTSEEVTRLLAEYGPNVIAEDKPNPFRLFFKSYGGQCRGCSRPRWS